MEIGFRPLTGISLFLYRVEKLNEELKRVFVPSRGFLFFYDDLPKFIRKYL